MTPEALQTFLEKEYPSIDFVRNDIAISFYIDNKPFIYELNICIVPDGTALEYWLWFCDDDQNRLDFYAHNDGLLAEMMLELHEQFDWGNLYLRREKEGSRYMAVFRMDIVPKGADVVMKKVAMLLKEAQYVTDVLGAVASSQICAVVDVKTALQMQVLTSMN